MSQTNHRAKLVTITGPDSYSGKNFKVEIDLEIDDYYYDPAKSAVHGKISASEAFNADATVVGPTDYTVSFDVMPNGDVKVGEFANNSLAYREMKEEVYMSMRPLRALEMFYPLVPPTADNLKFESGSSSFKATIIERAVSVSNLLSATLAAKLPSILIHAGVLREEVEQANQARKDAEVADQARRKQEQEEYAAKHRAHVEAEAARVKALMDTNSTFIVDMFSEGVGESKVEEMTTKLGKLSMTARKRVFSAFKNQLSIESQKSKKSAKKKVFLHPVYIDD